MYVYSTWFIIINISFSLSLSLSLFGSRERERERERDHVAPTNNIMTTFLLFSKNKMEAIVICFAAQTRRNMLQIINHNSYNNNNNIYNTRINAVDNPYRFPFCCRGIV